MTFGPAQVAGGVPRVGTVPSAEEAGSEVRALIVYESMYGNTHLIADAIASGLGAGTTVAPVDLANEGLVGAAELLVVGGPTHVHGMTRASTRQAAIAAAQEPDSDLTLDPDAYGEGLRDWFHEIGDRTNEQRAAAFDTRMPGPSAFTGRASKGIAKRLRHHGYDLVVEPESFVVTKENHLADDEVIRARQWGERLAAAMAYEPSS